MRQAAGGAQLSPSESRALEALFQSSTPAERLSQATTEVCASPTPQKAAQYQKLINNAFARLEGGDGAASGAVSGGAGISWQTALLNGLADFLVDRAKQESVLWLVSTFKDKLCASGREWFVETCAALREDLNQTGLPGNVLASAVRKDLEQLPVRAILGTRMPDQLSARSLAEYLSQLTQQVMRTKVAGTLAKSPVVLLAGAVAEVTGTAIECKAAAQTAPACVLSAASKVLEQLTKETAALSCDAQGQPSEGLKKAEEVVRTLFGGHKLSGWWATVLSCDKDGAAARQAFAELFKAGQDLDAAVAALVAMSEADRKRAESWRTTSAAIAALLEKIGAVVEAGTHPDSAEQRKGTAQALKGLQIAALTVRGVEALAEVIQGVRAGQPPLEMLAGLESLYDDQVVRLACGSDKDKLNDDTICTVAAVGAMAVRFATLVEGLPNKSMNESLICSSIQDLATGADTALAALGVGDDVGLRKLKKNASKFSCKAGEFTGSDAEGAVEYHAARSVVRAAAELVVTITQWRTSSNGPSGAERAASVAQWTGDIVAGLAELSGGKLPEIQLALSGMSATSSMLRGKYADGVREVLVALKDNKAVFPEPVRRYLLLLGDLAEAQTANQVQAALESAAAPVGSWRLKRQSFVVSVSGIVGAHTSFEVATDLSQKGYGWGLGLAAMLGVDLAWPIDNQHSSVGLYLSALDVGQLAYARVSSSSLSKEYKAVEASSDVSFMNVLSPGAYLRFGVRRSPFTVALGCSYSPQLRNVLLGTNKSNGDPNKEPFDAVRCGALLGVDVTILPF